MPSQHAEQPLGGNISGSVRVGDTVRRRCEPSTPAVQALLAHLRRAGFDAAPEPLGVDDHGRAVLRFIDGEAHPGWPDPMPRWMYEDDVTLTTAARLLRRFHEAVTTFAPPQGSRWMFAAEGRHEIICHNDWAPYNALFRGHEPVVMLDWDSAGPGTRVGDVALSAHQWVPLYPKADGVSNDPVLTLAKRASRLATFCAAYGDVTPAQVVATLIDQLPVMGARIQEMADAGHSGFIKLAGWDVPRRLRKTAALLRAQRAELAPS